MSGDEVVRLARTTDGRIVRETDIEAAFYVGVGTVADLTENQPSTETTEVTVTETVETPVVEEEPPKAVVEPEVKRKPGRPKGSTRKPV